ncbi:MAG: DUF4215 domain-containing protein [Candidatus Pacearchaeota archaeon]
MKKSSLRVYKNKINRRLALLGAILVVSLALFAVFIWIATDIILLAPPESVVLNWQYPSGTGVFFRVERSLTSNFASFEIVANNLADNVLTYNDPLSGLSPSTTYYYRVIACIDSASVITCSSPSGTASVTTPALSQCNVGDVRFCYTGPSGTSGIGVCSDGLESCIDAGFESGQWSGVCIGQVTPSNEQCTSSGSTSDFDCDGLSNCADLNSCSSDPTCVSPALTGSLIDGVLGSTILTNQPHTLTLLGSNIHTDAQIFIGGIDASIFTTYTISPSGTSVNINFPAVPGFIDPTVAVYVQNPNSPNPLLSSNSLNVVLNNPLPVATSISPQVITNPSNPSGFTTLTLFGSGFVPTTDLLVTPPSSSGLSPFLTSAFFGSPYVDENTLQFPLLDAAPAGTYLIQAVTIDAFGATLSSTVFSLNVINPSSCSLTDITPGCPSATSVLPITVSNNNGIITVTGASETGGTFDSNYVLTLNGGLLNLITTQNGNTLTANIAPSVSQGSYTVHIIHTGNGKISNGLSLTVFEESPSITGINPSSFNVNAPLSTTLTGTGFYPLSTIELTDTLNNLIPLGSSGFISATQMTYSIDTGLSLPGIYSLKVTNPSGSFSAPITLMINSVCGDGNVQGSETCDDGGAISSDGCSSSCLIETGYTCTSSVPNVCTLIPVCGNGIVQSGEQCDDNNLNGADGCSSTCIIESGYSCTAPVSALSVCTLLCGNGIADSNEFCNDGGLTCSSGLNCNTATCQCFGSGSAGVTAPSSGGSGGGGGSAGSTSGGGSSVPAPTIPNNNVPTSGGPSGITTPTAGGASAGADTSEDGFVGTLKNLFAGEGELRLAYWLVVFVLGGGILVVAVLIARTLRQRSRIMNLAKSSLPDLRPRPPPSGYGGTGGYSSY